LKVRSFTEDVLPFLVYFPERVRRAGVGRVVLGIVITDVSARTLDAFNKAEGPASKSTREPAGEVRNVSPTGGAEGDSTPDFLIAKEDRRATGALSCCIR